MSGKGLESTEKPDPLHEARKDAGLSQDHKDMAQHKEMTSEAKSANPAAKKALPDVDVPAGDKSDRQFSWSAEQSINPPTEGTANTMPDTTIVSHPGKPEPASHLEFPSLNMDNLKPDAPKTEFKPHMGPDGDGLVIGPTQKMQDAMADLINPKPDAPKTEFKPHMGPDGDGLVIGPTQKMQDAMADLINPKPDVPKTEFKPHVSPDGDGLIIGPTQKMQDAMADLINPKPDVPKTEFKPHMGPDGDGLVIGPSQKMQNPTEGEDTLPDGRKRKMVSGADGSETEEIRSASGQLEQKTKFSKDEHGNHVYETEKYDKNGVRTSDEKDTFDTSGRLREQRVTTGMQDLGGGERTTTTKYDESSQKTDVIETSGVGPTSHKKSTHYENEVKVRETEESGLPGNQTKVRTEFDKTGNPTVRFTENPNGTTDAENWTYNKNGGVVHMKNGELVLDPTHLPQHPEHNAERLKPEQAPTEPIKDAASELSKGGAELRGLLDSPDHMGKVLALDVLNGDFDQYNQDRKQGNYTPEQLQKRRDSFEQAIAEGIHKVTNDPNDAEQATRQLHNLREAIKHGALSPEAVKRIEERYYKTYGEKIQLY